MRKPHDYLFIRRTGFPWKELRQLSAKKSYSQPKENIRSLSLCLSLFLSVSLSLNIFHSFFYRFYCLFWVGERRLGSGHICFFPAKKNWKRCYFIWSFKHQNNVILVLCRLKLNFKLLSFASDYVASLSLFLATDLTARTQRLLCLHSLETQNSFCGQHDKT